MNSLYDGFFWIFWEGLMINDILMEVISEKVATSSASMAVIHCKKSRFDTVFINIEDYADSIFVVVS